MLRTLKIKIKARKHYYLRYPDFCTLRFCRYPFCGATKWYKPHCSQYWSLPAPSKYACLCLSSRNTIRIIHASQYPMTTESSSCFSHLLPASTSQERFPNCSKIRDGSLPDCLWIACVWFWRENIDFSSSLRSLWAVLDTDWCFWRR